MSSVLRHNTQQTFFLHSRHSQYTQFHFRCSGLKNVSSGSRTQKYVFCFPDLKIWVQFYDTILNRHSFCITARVNVRNSISDLLDWKLWVQIPELKNMSSVFRTWKTWVQFYDTILNRLYFCIHATVNICNPISDFLDSKLWVQFPQIKYVSSVFRT